MSRKYRFIRLPIGDSGGRVSVGATILKEKDLGKIIETDIDLNGNIHFEPVTDKLEVKEKSESVLSGISSLKLVEEEKGLEIIEPIHDFLDSDQGFILPPDIEKVRLPKKEKPKVIFEVKKVPRKKAGEKEKTKRSKSMPKDQPDEGARVYSVTCYQCSRTFSKKTRDILSIPPWELICSECENKK